MVEICTVYFIYLQDFKCIVVIRPVKFNGTLINHHVTANCPLSRGSVMLILQSVTITNLTSKQKAHVQAQLSRPARPSLDAKQGAQPEKGMEKVRGSCGVGV